MTLDLYRGDLQARTRELTTLTADERRRRAVAAASVKDAEALWALCEAYLAQHSTAGVLVSPHTIRNYRSSIRTFLAYAESHAWNLLRPDRDTAQRWIGDQLAGGAKIGTVRARVAAAAMLYRALRWADATTSSPFQDVIVPRDGEHPLDKNPPYSDDVLQRVMSRVQHDVHTLSDRRRARAVEVWALLLLLLHSGLRVSEVLALRWEDLQLDTPEPLLLVRAGKGRKSRTVPVSDRLTHALRAYRVLPRSRAHRGTYVLPYRTWPGAAKHLRPYFDRADGTSDWRGFHAFRKSMGTRLYEQLEDFVAVAEILGHAKVDTTRAYVRVGSTRARKALRTW